MVLHIAMHDLPDVFTYDAPVRVTDVGLVFDQFRLGAVGIGSAVGPEVVD